MNKIIPIVIVGIVIVIGIVVISSTGGISSISYESMTCDELKKEADALWSTLDTATPADIVDIDKQLDVILLTSISKNC